MSNVSNVHVLGIRHHGPGSARLVERALRELAPDCVLIEGPPELTEVLSFARSREIQPPVAGFVYATDRPELASFDPFALFSPEWIALRYGLDNDKPVRFIDLPVSNDLAIRAATIDAARVAAALAQQTAASEPTDGSDEEGEAETDNTADNDADEHYAGTRDAAGPDDGPSVPLGVKARLDPIGLLAELAGAGDPEQWWEDVIEHRAATPPSGNVSDAQNQNHSDAPNDSDGRNDSDAQDREVKDSGSLESFAAVMDAMIELRAAADAEGSTYTIQGPIHPSLDPEREKQREASMRNAIRQAEKEGFATIVVVCGAWHAPVLQKHTFPSATSDAAVVKGLPKIKVSATWTPWTHRLLARSSGYGAGVTAPGWYSHVFRYTEAGTHGLVAAWMVNVARALRQEKHDASPASVIESVRLAEALAAMRNRPLAGLTEVNDATLTVLCGGSATRFALVNETVLIDQQLGTVPEDTPQVPLAKDFAGTLKRLRLKQSALAELVELDLRTPSGLERSRFFHRLQLIGIPWATPTANQTRTTGTFKETWATEWKPEIEISFVEASRYGTTVEAAAAGAALERAGTVPLPALTELLDQVLRGNVVLAISGVLDALNDRAAASHDVALLLDAIPALARIARYGDVRKTDTDAVTAVLAGIVVRVCAALPGATSQLDDDAAEELRARINDTHNALGTLDDLEQRSLWNGALLRIHRASTGHSDAVHGLVAGRVCRLLRDGGQLDTEESSASLSRVLSIGTDAAVGARWIEGFFSGGGLVLLHDVVLLDMVDEWMATVHNDTFEDVLPLLRRTFGSFASAERRMIGAAVKDRGSSGKAEPAESLDTTYALDAVAPTVLLLLGVTV